MDIRLANVIDAAGCATVIETSLDSSPHSLHDPLMIYPARGDLRNRRWLKAELLFRCAQHYNLNADALPPSRHPRLI